MFLTVKFRKYANAKFMSHLDMHASVARTLRRAQIGIAFSQGFNPHPILKLSSPIPLGVESDAEYFTVQLLDGYDKNGDILSKFNQSTPLGIMGVNCFFTQIDPKYTGKIYAYTYTIDFPEESYDDIKSFCSSVKEGNLEIEQRLDDANRSKFSNDYIYSLELKKNLVVNLAAGNKNLRIDALVKYITETHNVDLSLADVKKTQVEIVSGSKIYRIDDYLANI